MNETVTSSIERDKDLLLITLAEAQKQNFLEATVFPNGEPIPQIIDASYTHLMNNCEVTLALYVGVQLLKAKIKGGIGCASPAEIVEWWNTKARIENITKTVKN